MNGAIARRGTSKEKEPAPVWVEREASAGATHHAKQICLACNVCDERTIASVARYLDRVLIAAQLVGKAEGLATGVRTTGEMFRQLDNPHGEA